MALALAPQNDPFGSKLLGRRSLARVPMDLALRIHVAGLSGPLPARSRDIGVGGLCIATPTCFSLKDLSRVSLLHPTAKLDLVAEGRWQAEVPGRDAFLSGIRFPEVDAGTLDRLWDLVHDQTKQLSRWLSQQSDLKALDLCDLIELIHVMRLRDMSSGETVYRPESNQLGDDSILVVMKGRVVLETPGARGRKIALGEASCGQIVGGVALVCGKPSLESAVVSEAASFLEISRSAFSFLCSASAPLAADLASIVTRTHVERLHTALTSAAQRS
jgi:CRP-like cAMP-binding protein